MKKPLEILLGDKKDHPLLGPYLQNDVPDFQGIYSNIMGSLSSGEQLIVRVALALWNGHMEARVGDLHRLDSTHRAQVVAALIEALEVDVGLVEQLRGKDGA